MSELGHEVVHRPTKSRRYSGRRYSGLLVRDAADTHILADTSRLRLAKLIVPAAAALEFVTIAGARAWEGVLGGGCGGVPLGRRHSQANRHEQCCTAQHTATPGDAARFTRCAGDCGADRRRHRSYYGGCDAVGHQLLDADLNSELKETRRRFTRCAGDCGADRRRHRSYYGGCDAVGHQLLDADLNSELKETMTRLITSGPTTDYNNNNIQGALSARRARTRRQEARHRGGRRARLLSRNSSL